MDILVGTLLAIVAFQALAFAGLYRAAERERRAFAAERSRLLDRIMARSYNEFAYTATSAVETPQLTTDEAEAKWAISHRGDADELWHQENAKEHPELYPDGVGETT